MASTSAIDVAEDALLALLAADTTLSALGLGVPQLGEPQTPAREHVWIYEEASTTQRQVVTGATRGRRMETAELRVGVLVAKTKDYLTCRNRVTVLTAIVEDLVRNTPKLGSADVYDTELIRTDRFSAPLGDGMRAVLNIVVLQVRAYLA